MYSQVAKAYQRTGQATANPRELESSLLIRAAARLQSIRDNWDETPERERDVELDDALTYNRKLWTILVTSATQEENPLPLPIKQNIANLGLFIFSHTNRILANPAPEKLGSLININRQIAAGLRGSQQSDSA